MKKSSRRKKKVDWLDGRPSKPHLDMRIFWKGAFESTLLLEKCVPSLLEKCDSKEVLNYAFKRLQELWDEFNMKDTRVTDPKRRKFVQEFLAKRGHGGVSKEQWSKNFALFDDRMSQSGIFAGRFLAQARGAIEEGRSWLKEVDSLNTLAASSGHKSLSLAVVYAFYAGVAASEFNARVQFGKVSGSSQSPKRRGSYNYLTRVTMRCYADLHACDGKVNTDDLRDRVASKVNDIQWHDWVFYWYDERGNKKETTDKAWQNRLSLVRKRHLLG